MTTTVPARSMPTVNPLDYDENLRRVLLYLTERMDDVRHLVTNPSGPFVIQMQPVGGGRTSVFTQDRMTYRQDGSNLLDGSLELPTRSVTAATSLRSTDFGLFCNATSAAFSVYLPAVNKSAGRLYAIVKTDVSANAVTIAANGSNKINGAATYALAAQFNAVVIQSDGINNWYGLGKI